MFQAEDEIRIRGLALAFVLATVLSVLAGSRLALFLLYV
jgi:hypothetical protein